MKIFLSGKIDEKYGAWRNEIVGFRHDWVHKRRVPNWVVVQPYSVLDYKGTDLRWPEGCSPNTRIFGVHDYVGPYRTEYLVPTDSKYSGEFHGHEVVGQHGCPDDDAQTPIADACKRAIANADLVFAYLNSPDCFGSLVEIGFAWALGKYVYLTIDPEAQWEWGDYWFAGEFANLTHYRDRDERDGTDWITRRLQDAIVKWAATVNTKGNSKTSLTADISSSLAQIERWTSDPRTRDQVKTLLGRTR